MYANLNNSKKLKTIKICIIKYNKFKKTKFNLLYYVYKHFIFYNYCYIFMRIYALYFIIKLYFYKKIQNLLPDIFIYLL